MIRYRFLAAVCPLLRHPESRARQPDGVVYTTCRCGHIDKAEEPPEGQPGQQREIADDE